MGRRMDRGGKGQVTSFRGMDLKRVGSRGILSGHRRNRTEGEKNHAKRRKGGKKPAESFLRGRKWSKGGKRVPPGKTFFAGVKRHRRGGEGKGIFLLT